MLSLFEATLAGKKLESDEMTDPVKNSDPVQLTGDEIKCSTNIKISINCDITSQKCTVSKSSERHFNTYSKYATFLTIIFNR